MNSRRTFIKQTALMTAGILAAPSLTFAKPDKKVGIQLYTLRDYIGKDVKGVITKVAKAGYKKVETYGYSVAAKYWGLAPAEFAALLKDNGLTAPSGHYGMDRFLSSKGDEDLKAFIEAGNILGHEYITIPSLGGALRKTADDVKHTAGMLNQAAELCKKSGLKLGYHNHATEFGMVGDQSVYDILLRETDPKLVYFQADLYWVVRGGKDPLELFAQHPGRFTMWHVKDMDKVTPTRNTEVGNGSIDYKKIFAKAKQAGLVHIIMEQENFDGDPYQSITSSCDFIKNRLL